MVCVDLYGQTADYGRIEAVCAEFGVPLIEDAAEALGADCGGRPAGSFGACSIFSFNGNKVITTSGGGMLGSDDPSITDRARFLATQAREPAPHYEHETVGYNYRLSNVLAALGRAQLLTLDERVAARRRIFERYRTTLGDLPGVDFMPEASHGNHARWLTVMTVDPAVSRLTREQLRRALDEADIEARPAWKPMHLQPVFADAGFVGTGVSDVLFERGLCLPSGSGLSAEDQDRVIDVIRDACSD